MNNKVEYCSMCRHIESNVCKHCDLYNKHQFGDRSTLHDEGYTNFFEEKTTFKQWLMNIKPNKRFNSIFHDIWQLITRSKKSEKTKAFKQIKEVQNEN